jgi:hypothetical protein
LNTAVKKNFEVLEGIIGGLENEQLESVKMIDLLKKEMGGKESRSLAHGKSLDAEKLKVRGLEADLAELEAKKERVMTEIQYVNNDAWQIWKISKLEEKIYYLGQENQGLKSQLDQTPLIYAYAGESTPARHEEMRTAMRTPARHEEMHRAMQKP